MENFVSEPSTSWILALGGAGVTLIGMLLMEKEPPFFRFILWMGLVAFLLLAWKASSVIWPGTVSWIDTIQFKGILTRHAPNWYHWTVLIVMGFFVGILSLTVVYELGEKKGAIVFTLGLLIACLLAAYQAAHNIWPGILPGL